MLQSSTARLCFGQALTTLPLVAALRLKSLKSTSSLRTHRKSDWQFRFAPSPRYPSLPRFAEGRDCRYHIHTICDGWDVQKCNIDGIYVVDRKISVPCYAIEYDTVYGGGDYSGSGDIYYLQVPIVERIYGGNVEEAFADLSGHKLSNIIHWSPDNLVTLEGDEWAGTMNTFLF